MPRRPKFQVTKTQKGWRINVPKSVSATGKREQYFYPTRDKAVAAKKEYLEKYSAHGSAASVISPQLAEDAVKAAELLKPWDATLTEAAKFYVKEMERRNASRPTDQTCKEWLAIREQEVRPRTLEGYRSAAKKLTTAFGTKLLSEITKDQLQKVIAPPGTRPPTAAANLRNARVFWLWAAAEGLCEAEVIQKVKTPKNKKEGTIGILKPAEASLLLKAAEKHFPQAVPLFAVQLFAGIRAEEVTKLKAANFTEAGIELGGEVTKKGRRRHINPSPTLAAWLKKYPFKPCPNWQRVSRAVKHLAGFETWVAPGFIPKGIKPLSKPAIPWPQNALRHSHATYAIAAGMELQTLLFEFGHTEGESTLREHYTGRASKKVALEYFAIVPKGAKKPQTISAA
jgi:integrase/recombinase XerD